MMKPTIRYIIQFLLGNAYSPEIANLIGYTSDKSEFHRYRIIIIPSGFFDPDVYGSTQSIPKIPLKKINDIPLLFGTPIIEQSDNKLFIKADIIASSYFFLSRYEEFVRWHVRDIHGRFPGKESLPYRADFIDRPVVDEYGNLLRQWLKSLGVVLPEIPQKLNKVYLTHDVDIPFLYQRFLSFAKGLLIRKEKIKIIQSFFGKRTSDPAYTFPWIIEQNKSLEKIIGRDSCETIFFFKSIGGHQNDRPLYDLDSKDIQNLISLCKTENITIGLHSSYLAGMIPKLIQFENFHLKEISGSDIKFNRHHYLSCREPKDFEYLIKYEITDDFTMGYADVAGFRLGTCRQVLWINPARKKMTSLKLHPLTVMECTLDRPNYMGLNFDQAFHYCKDLIEKTKQFNGDLTLLWHNTSLIENKNNYQKKLYQLLIEELKNI